MIPLGYLLLFSCKEKRNVPIDLQLESGVIAVFDSTHGVFTYGWSFRLARSSPNTGRY